MVLSFSCSLISTIVKLISFVKRSLCLGMPSGLPVCVVSEVIFKIVWETLSNECARFVVTS